MMKSEGGSLYVCTNEQGAVMAKLLGQGIGSLGLMSSMMTNEENCFMTQPGHGPLKHEFLRHLDGHSVSVNPIASIISWTRTLMHIASIIDANESLFKFCLGMEQAVLSTVENGYLTKDLAMLVHNRWDVREGLDYVSTKAFL